MVILSHDQAHYRPSVRIILGQNGPRGVQLFFALSGLLICGRLLQEEAESGSISLRGFYIRRFFRLQPAAYAYLAILAILTLTGLIPAFWRGIAGAVLMIRDIWPLNSGDGDWFTGHFWSLSVEEHFYLVLPLFLVLVRRYRLAILSVATILAQAWTVTVFSHRSLQHYGNVYVRTDTRLGPILFGAAVAVLLTRPGARSAIQRFVQPWVALLYAAAVLWRLQVHHSRYDEALLFTIYLPLLVSTMLHPESIVSRCLELPPMRFLGRLSYSLYLWQQIFFMPFHPPAPGSFRSHWVLCWIAAFACATASYFLIETPMIRIGHRIAMKYTHAPSEAQRPEPVVV